MYQWICRCEWSNPKVHNFRICPNCYLNMSFFYKMYTFYGEKASIPFFRLSKKVCGYKNLREVKSKSKVEIKLNNIMCQEWFKILLGHNGFGPIKIVSSSPTKWHLALLLLLLLLYIYIYIYLSISLKILQKHWRRCSWSWWLSGEGV